MPQMEGPWGAKSHPVIRFFENIINIIKLGSLWKMTEPYSTARFGHIKWRGLGEAQSHPAMRFFESIKHLIRLGSSGKIKEPHNRARFGCPKWWGPIASCYFFLKLSECHKIGKFGGNERTIC